MAHDRVGGLTGWDFEGFHNGGDTELWRRLGSAVVTVEDDERGPVSGVRFSVWAPNARSVQVIGDFNWWTGDQMQLVPVRSGACHRGPRRRNAVQVPDRNRRRQVDREGRPDGAVQ